MRLKEAREPRLGSRVRRLRASALVPLSPKLAALIGAAVSPTVAPTFCGGRAHGNLCVVRQVERRTRRCAMRPQEIGIAERTEEISWRHVWLKSVLIDAGNPFPTKIYRPRPTRRMSVTRRLEKLHRMRATLEPQRSWMAR